MLRQNVCLKQCLPIILNIKQTIIRSNGADLTGIDFTAQEIQLNDSELFIGDDTTAYLLDLPENEGMPVTKFYKRVRSFYIAFVQKLTSKFDFKSTALSTFSLLIQLVVRISPRAHLTS
jgi:hypothetical protein